MNVLELKTEHLDYSFRCIIDKAGLSDEFINEIAEERLASNGDPNYLIVLPFMTYINLVNQIDQMNNVLGEGIVFTPKYVPKVTRGYSPRRTREQLSRIIIGLNKLSEINDL